VENEIFIAETDVIALPLFIHHQYVEIYQILLGQVYANVFEVYEHPGKFEY
jgi:hypothetical protein